MNTISIDVQSKKKNIIRGIALLIICTLTMAMSGHVTAQTRTGSANRTAPGVDAYALMCTDCSNADGEVPLSKWKGTIVAKNINAEMEIFPFVDGAFAESGSIMGSYKLAAGKVKYVLEGSYTITNRTESEADVAVEMYERNPSNGNTQALFVLKGKCTRTGCQLSGTYEKANGKPVKATLQCGR